MTNEPPFITAKNTGSWAHASVVERLPAILQKLQTYVSVPSAFAGEDAETMSQRYHGLVSKPFCDELTDILKQDGAIPLMYVRIVRRAPPNDLFESCEPSFTISG
jgi:hypothetical protein